MNPENESREQGVIRIDIAKTLGIVVLIVLSVLMLIYGIAFCAFALSLFNFDLRVIVCCALGTVFCIALIGFIHIYKRVFGKNKDKAVDIEFNR